MALSAPFASWVLREGGLPEVKVLAAVARQVVYGGGLDTALLEGEVLAVEDLWALLSRATGLAIPPVALLAKREWAPLPLSSEVSQECRAVPAAERADGVLQLLCAEPVELAALHRHSTKVDRTFELFIVPEVHLEALRSALYGRPMPARLAKLWVRLVGRSGLRTRPAPRPAANAMLGALPGVFGDVDAPLGSVAAPRVRREEVGESTPAIEASSESTTPLQAVMGLDDESHPAWSESTGEEEGDQEATTATNESKATNESTATDESKATNETAATKEATDFASQLPPPLPRSTQERAIDQGETSFASSFEPSPASETSSALGGAGAEAEATPEAPFALTLDFEAEPPLSDEPSLADEARASAVAWETFSATEALCRRARDAHDSGRMLALRALRRRLNMPPVPNYRRYLVAMLDGDGPDESMRALSDLTEMRDRDAVPAIVPLLEASDRKLAAAARQALMLLTLQDFGQKKRKWQSWWEEKRHTPPTDWLFEGLSHREAPIRLAAAEELRQITGAYFGYHFDLPKQDREDAKRRWQTWWWAMTEHEREEAEG